MFSAYKAIAATAFLIMLSGLLLRHRNPRRHAQLMGLAMGLDLLVVLLLEIQRDAIATAVSMTLGAPQMIHIAASSLATALYLPVALLGYRRLKGHAGPTACRAHLLLGVFAFSARGIGFCFMWTVHSA